MAKLWAYLFFFKVPAMRGFKHFFTDRPINTRRITVRGVGINEEMAPGIVHRPNGTEDWLFMLFYDPVMLGVDGVITPQPAHTLMIRRPWRMQYYGSTERRWRHTWVHCDGEHVRRLARQLRLPTEQPIHHADPATAEQHLLALHEELTRPTGADEVIVCNLLENWLRQVRRRIDLASETDAVPKAFLEARQYLDRHYDQPVRLGDLAGRMHLTEPHVCSMFGRYFGISPMNYVIRLRLRHAAHLLGDRNLSVSRIASMVGYDDLYHFSKLFKKHLGVSPMAMRRRGGGTLRVTR